MLRSALVKDNPDYIGDAVAIAAFRGDADTAIRLSREDLRNPIRPARRDWFRTPYVMRLQKDPRWLPLLRKMEVDPETLSKIRFTSDAANG